MLGRLGESTQERTRATKAVSVGRSSAVVPPALAAAAPAAGSAGLAEAACWPLDAARKAGLGLDWLVWLNLATSRAMRQQAPRAVAGEGGRGRLQA